MFVATVWSRFYVHRTDQKSEAQRKVEFASGHRMGPAAGLEQNFNFQFFAWGHTVRSHTPCFWGCGIPVGGDRGWWRTREAGSKGRSRATGRGRGADAVCVRYWMQSRPSSRRQAPSPDSCGGAGPPHLPPTCHTSERSDILRKKVNDTKFLSSV